MKKKEKLIECKYDSKGRVKNISIDLPSELDEIPDLILYLIDSTTKEKLAYIRYKF